MLAPEVSVLEQFIEKPDQLATEDFIASAVYLWNSGVFMLTATLLSKSLTELQPEMARICWRTMQKVEREMDFIQPDTTVLVTCPSDSIDYAAMERTPEGAVASLDCDWIDIGAWSALWEAGEPDASGKFT